MFAEEDAQILGADVLVSELGVTGLRHRGGDIQEEIVKELQGDKRHKIYAQMANNDAVLGSSLETLKLTSRSAIWEIEAANDSPEAKEAAEFVRGALFEDMSHTFNSFLMEALSMFEHGFSWFEVVYKQRNGTNIEEPGKGSSFSDGRWGWRKFAIRAQDTVLKWFFDDNGGIRGMQQRDPNGKKGAPFIPIAKSLLFRTTEHKGNPQGKSILRNAYRSWYYKTHIEELQAIGIERDLAGIPVASVPARLLNPNASPEDKTALAAIKELVTNIRRNEQEGIVYPLVYDQQGRELYKLELMTSGGSRQFDTREIIKQHNIEMALALLTDFVLIGHERVGTFALSASKLHSMSLVVDSYLDGFTDVFNRHELPRLWFINNLSPDIMPQLIHSEVTPSDLNEVGTLILKMAQSGMTVADLNNEIRRRAKLPITTTAEDFPGSPQLEIDDPSLPEPRIFPAIPDSNTVIDSV
jgi:hypothetical protein